MYRLFLLKDASDDAFEKNLQMLQKFGPQISAVSIVSCHNFLPKHIHFKTDTLSDEGVDRLIKERLPEKSWKLLKEPTRKRVLF